MDLTAPMAPMAVIMAAMALMTSNFFLKVDFGSYMYENFGNFLLIIFTISKIDFTIKKQISGRKLGNLE